MAWACGLGLLLPLLLSVVSASTPGAVVRLNNEVLSYVSEIGKAHLQRALQVTVPHFLDQSGDVLQPTRIQILNVHVTRLHLKFIAGFGIRLLAAANFTFKVFRIPEPLELTLPEVLLADARVALGSIETPVVSTSACFSLVGRASVTDGSNSTSPALLVLVEKHIKAVLSNKLCLSISNLVQGLNVHLGTLIGLNPVGPESQIRYSMIDMPTITSDYISLDVNAVLFLLGKPIVLPKDTSPFVLPPHVGTQDAMATVGLSQHLFDSAFLLLQKAGSLNLDITGQLNSDDNLLNTSVLGQLIPEVARQFPEPMPLVLKVRLGATPVATLHTNNATLQLQPFVEVLVAASNSAFDSLFSLDVVVNLSLQLSVSKAKLQGTTSVLGDVQLTVASSNVGSIDTDQVYALMGTVFEKPLLDHLNALLGMGIALPSVVNLLYVNPEVFVYEGYVVISSGLFYPTSTETAPLEKLRVEQLAAQGTLLPQISRETEAKPH
ncbi:PREDICTED: BPI fold-containing family B member 2 [Galeopterus variegatus]|uniref:BPI fold-containing family B member 2 n=1 Tax=Galeopterus variegatus TaxID=482537 RepID=A0ABM0R3J8_GALVR|nr:PREDICTED: BPI fold-containing family B member 2 [Galeopterus variegatus]